MSMPAITIGPVNYAGLVVSLLFIVVKAQTVSAQLPGASPAVLGTGDNYTALARGFTAISVNPAGLGMSDNPGFSLAIVPIQLRIGVDPLTLNNLKSAGDFVVSGTTKAYWLDQITEAGELTSRGGLDATPLAFTTGRVGFQISTVGEGSVELGPDATELVLFGNAGRTGTARDLRLAGTRMDAWAATTAALGFGIPIGGAIDQSFAVGMTLKYTVGHTLVLGRDSGSLIQNNPVEIDLRFPSIAPSSDEGSSVGSILRANNGTGVGIDVGGAWQSGKLMVGVTIQNLFNTFEWDLDGFVYRSGKVLVNDTVTTLDDFDLEQAVALAPASLREEALGQRFGPAFAVGMAYRATSKITITADAQHNTSETLVVDEASHLGVGLEFRPVQILFLRSGISLVSTGRSQYAMGLGLVLGPVNLSAGVLSESGSGDYTVGSVALSFGHH